MQNIDEKTLLEIIKRELKKYYEEKDINFEVDDEKEDIIFLGDDENIKNEFRNNYNFKEDALKVVISKLSLKNLFNISKGFYTDDYEKIILNYLLNSKKIIVLEEGIEFYAYNNIPLKLLEKYKKYVEDLKSFGVKILKKNVFLNYNKDSKGKYTKKLLSLEKVKELERQGNSKISISNNTIITSAAQEYAKEKNIEIVKGS